jgi:hypothetical protein
MHRYRAILFDSGNTTQERPIQIFGNDRAKLEEWAEVVLKTAVSPNAGVLIYQTIEQQVGLIPKRKPENQEPAK